MKTIRKVFNGIIKDINIADRTLTALVSTDAQDRMDDVLEPKGADLKNFKKNPVVLWAHDYSAPPIAKALWIKKSGDGLLSKMKFASTEFAQEIFDLYKDGFLNAFSVGFIPKESEPVDIKNETDVFGGKRFVKWELLEYSAVPVPANPEALALAVSKGIISEDQKKTLDEMIDIEDKDNGDDSGDGEDAEEDDEDEEEEGENKDPEGKDSSDSQAIDLEPLKGLSDLMAENELFNEKIVALEKENADLRYKIYVQMDKKKAKKPEITVDNLADKFRDIVDGVIRQAQGKVD